MRFHGPIPLTIRPMFWLFAALIGYLFSQTLVGTLIWIGIIFVSVLFHEYGHALTAMLFGQKPRIELVALGGLTFHNGQNLPYWKQFFIVLNGPLFGFLLVLFSFFLLKIPVFSTGLAENILQDLYLINLFWTVVNLLPVMPLDGGQLLRIACEAIFGSKGFRYSLVISMGIAFLISLGFFLLQSFLIGALFFLFAYQGFEMWRRTAKMGESDQRGNLQEIFAKAEELLIRGQIQEASSLLVSLREQAKKGLIWSMATQQLAMIQYHAGDRPQAYMLLREAQDDLGEEAVQLLHELAFEEKNYPLVSDLAARAYQYGQGAEIALRSAYACAQLKQVRQAVGWLSAVRERSTYSVQEIIQKKFFDPIRQEPLFEHFVASLNR